MLPLIRTIVYAGAFIALVLVFLPARVLEWSGVTAPAGFGVAQGAGLVFVVLGGGLALWCVGTFGTVGRGTPAPFDPPRRLVMRGPYRFVRNPMYLGAGLALAGASLYFRAPWLLAYTAAFFVVTHFFVVLYEERRLSRTFGPQYEAYRTRVRRWIPTRAAPGS